MNNFTVNFTSGASTNSTTHCLKIMEYLEISVYSINVLFGSLTHSYVLWLIVTGSSAVASEFFNLNLCVCELGICLESLLSVLSMWFAGLTQFKLFFIGFSAAGRPQFQCLMCVERYLAVVHPVTFLKYKPLRYRLICCAVVWIIIIVACVFSTFSMAWQNGYIHTWLLSFHMIFFLSVQLFCLVAVLRALKQSGPGERKREKEENRMKRRAFQIILITSVNIVFMYVPKAVAGFYDILRGAGASTNIFTALTCFLLTGYVQPVLFLHRSGKLSCCCLL